MLMDIRLYVDFNLVHEHHREIDLRLTNWGRWCCSRSGGVATSPAFRLYRSTEQWRGLQTGVSGSIDKIDAQRVQKAVQALPEKHRHAVNWSYVYRNAPVKMAKGLGVSLDGLQELVHQGRQMLVNRNV